MRHLITLVAVAFLAYGLWNHDWTTIFAAFLLAVIWPLIAHDVEMRSERRVLDKLWDEAYEHRPRDWTLQPDGSYELNDDLGDSA